MSNPYVDSWNPYPEIFLEIIEIKRCKAHKLGDKLLDYPKCDCKVQEIKDR